jgi:hypothetical protein
MVSLISILHLTAAVLSFPSQLYGHEASKVVDDRVRDLRQSQPYD